MIEEVTQFGALPLAGVLSRPTGSPRPDMPGVVLFNPGLLHHVGPNRLYVKIARALAEDGFNVLRFDYAGQGDSPSRTDNLPLERAAMADAQAAIDHIVDQCGCERVLLAGHCSGGLMGLMRAFEDHRVAGVISISPEGGDQGWVEYDRRRKESRFYSNYYSREALSDSGRWRRLLTGKANYRGIARTFFLNVIWYRLSALGFRLRAASGMGTKTVEERPEVAQFRQGLRGLADRRLPILMIHPDQSSGRELMRAILGDALRQLHAAGNLEVAHVTASDHMFTPMKAQQDLIETIHRWVRAKGFVPALVATSGEEVR